MLGLIQNQASVSLQVDLGQQRQLPSKFHTCSGKSLERLIHGTAPGLRRSINPKGFISQTALDDCQRNFAILGLMYEKIDKGSRPKTFLVITEKGKHVAEKIREIQEILEE